MVKMAPRTDHGVNILGAFDSLHFAKLLTVGRHPTQQIMAIFSTILHPRTFPMIQVEPSHLVHYHKSRRQGSQQRPE